MTDDALRSLLIAADAPPPERDLSFVIGVMEQVERRRFVVALATWLLGGSLVTALMGLIMPQVTPVLVDFGQEIVPAAAVLTITAAATVAWAYMRPILSRIDVPGN